MGILISEVYAIEPSGEVEELLSVFSRMVKWWGEKAGSRVWKRYDELRTAYYRDWLAEFRGWSTQMAHSSALEAHSRLRLDLPPEERAVAAEMDLPIAILHPQMIKIEEGKMRVAAKKGKYIFINLKPLNILQEALLKQAEQRMWRVGQVTLSRNWAIIPFSMSRVVGESIKVIDDLIKLLYRK